MSKKTSKSMPKFLVSVNKLTKLSIQIPQKTMNLVEDYQKFHAEISGEKVDLDNLVAAIINSGLTSDKNFLKWRKEASEPNV